jgi:hypothetical protein
VEALARIALVDRDSPQNAGRRRAFLGHYGKRRQDGPSAHLGA